MSTATIDKTKKVYKFIRHCPIREAKIMFIKIKKDLVKATVAVVQKKNAALVKGKSKDGTKAVCEAKATNNEEKEEERK